MIVIGILRRMIRKPMKFKIFTLSELIYRKVVYTFVLFFTIGIIIVYFLTRAIDESAYVLSIFYALFLFIVSIYMNSKSTQIQNMFYKRIEQYRSLGELSGIYTPGIRKNDDLLSFILMVQGLTGRLNDKGRAIIKFNGFEYTEKYLNLEESYLNQRKALYDLLNGEIKNHIKSHNLKKKVPNVFIHYPSEFIENVSGWIDDNLDLTEDETEKFLTFTKELRVVYKGKFNKLDKTERRINKMIRKISKKCHINRVRIEKLYGDMLFESLARENEFLLNFNVIEKLLRELNNEVIVQSDFAEITEDFARMQQYLSNIEEKLEVVKQDIEDISAYIN